MSTITTLDTKADAHAATGALRVRLQDELHDSLRSAQYQGVHSMSRRELRDFHAQRTGKHLELASVASSVNALIAAGRMEEGEARVDQVTGRLVKPLRCKARQTALS